MKLSYTLHSKTYGILPVFFLAFFLVLQAQTPTSTENYIMSIEPLVSMSSVPEDLSQLADDEKKVTIMYYDGLGREKQLVEHKQSLYMGVNSDKVTHFEYDEFGRKAKDYLPVPTRQLSGEYISGVLTDYTNYYTPAYGTTAFYSEKELEASPLNRVTDQAAPGDDWAQGSGHEIKFRYLANSNSEVELFIVSTTWNSTYKVYDNTLTRPGKYYKPGELYKTITTDENGHDIEEFKNKTGQVILKRTYEGSHTLDTYYVYNKYDNLVFVVPPLAVSKSTMTSDILNGLCYQYRYDDKNRLGRKKLPGKEWEDMIYDRQNRLVAVQDGIQQLSDKWLFTKYDKYGRVVYTGIYTQDIVRGSLQGDVDNFGANNEQRDDKDGFTKNGLNVKYTKTAFPTSFDEILTVNYYDDYKFERNLHIPDDVFSVPVITHSPKTATHNVTTKTLLTAAMVRILTTDTWEKSYLFYDEKQRVLETKKLNHLEGYTITDNEYDFRGKVLQTKTLHRRTDTAPEIKTEDFYTYNRQEQLLTQTRKVNNGTEERIADNAYDPLGQLTRKGVGNAAALAALQKVDYSYNIRGWLTGINNVDGLAQGSDPVDLFTFRINYNDAVQSHFPSSTGIEPLYNGNIAETFWRTVSDNILRGYGYHYDEVNRLRDAYYQRPGATVPVPANYDEFIEYDVNGNITALNRYSGSDTPTGAQHTDELAYAYIANTNQLKKVTDATNAPEGFADGTNTGNDYTYDVNGNMLTDKNKGITTNITYNYLNLPTKIQWTSTKKIDYLYDAAGVKVQKKVTDGNKIITTDYLDGFQYEDQLLQFFPHSEGYVRVTTVGMGPTNPLYAFNYVYNYTDHLGNVRLSYAKDPQTGNLKVMEENNYYPFGLKHQNYGSAAASLDFQLQLDEWGVILAPVTSSHYKYKFNYRESQEELGLNLISMDYRNYDTSLGRFLNMDPLSDLAPMHTPYRFGFNNPVYWRDPSGLFESNGFETCPTCPNTPEFKPFIDDPDNEYVYDPETNSISEVVVLDEATVTGKKKKAEKDSDDANLEHTMNGLGGVADGLIMNTGSYRWRNGIYNGNQFSPKYYSSGWAGGSKAQIRTFKISRAGKVISRGTIVGSVLLEVPEVVEGFDESPEEGVKQLAGAGGGLAGAWAGGALGAEFGAAIGLFGGPFAEITVPGGAIIFGAGGAIVGGFWGENAVENMIENAKGKDLSPSGTLTPSEINFNSATGGNKW